MINDINFKPLFPIDLYLPLSHVFSILFFHLFLFQVVFILIFLYKIQLIINIFMLTIHMILFFFFGNFIFHVECSFVSMLPFFGSNKNKCYLSGFVCWFTIFVQVVRHWTNSKITRVLWKVLKLLAKILKH